jgi:hypothetical protein
MCESRETSREHAPPLCIFPGEPTLGRNVRKDLITVPSCDQHNSKKSNDDEFFRATLLLATAQDSRAASQLFFQKLMRAARRRPHAYRSFFRKQGTLAGMDQPVVRLSRPRFNSCVDHLVRALCFHATGAKWQHRIMVASPSFFGGFESGQVIPHQPSLDAIDLSRAYLAQEPIGGENPEIFKYRLRCDMEAQTLAFAGQFYEIFEVFAYSSRNPGGAAD